jgi:hypothetical protein
LTPRPAYHGLIDEALYLGRLGFMKQRRARFAVVLVVCASSIALFAQGKDDKRRMKRRRETKASSRA